MDVVAQQYLRLQLWRLRQHAVLPLALTTTHTFTDKRLHAVGPLQQATRQHVRAAMPYHACSKHARDAVSNI
jgi:hypothetical protein